MSVKDKSLRVGSYGAGELELRDLTQDEVDQLYGSFSNGNCWVRRGDNGRLESVSFFQPLPDPIQDPVLLPFWPPIGWEPDQYELFPHDANIASRLRHVYPSITIQHLCGYGYTPEKYAEQAELLEGLGFTCLRSRRGESGQYYEIWYLPGLWAAKGRLKEALVDSGQPKDQAIDVALEYLRQHASFGTLDVSVQRLAMTID